MNEPENEPENNKHLINLKQAIKENRALLQKAEASAVMKVTPGASDLLQVLKNQNRAIEIITELAEVNL